MVAENHQESRNRCDGFVDDVQIVTNCGMSVWAMEYSRGSPVHMKAHCQSSKEMKHVIGNAGAMCRSVDNKHTRFVSRDLCTELG